MKLKNILIAVKNLELSKDFYKNVFGLETVVHQDGNIVLTEGLVLQDASIWKQSIGKEIIPRCNGCQLYFEEADLDDFAKKLEKYYPDVNYVTPLMTSPWGQKLMRFYDPDGILIEVRTPMRNQA